MDTKDQLIEPFSIKGIAASEFDPVRGTMGTKDEFGGWGDKISERPYSLADRDVQMGVTSEKLAYVEATAVREQKLCIHGFGQTKCPYRRNGDPVCRVRAADGGQGIKIY